MFYSIDIFEKMNKKFKLLKYRLNDIRKNHSQPNMIFVQESAAVIKQTASLRNLNFILIIAVVLMVSFLMIYTLFSIVYLINGFPKKNISLNKNNTIISTSNVHKNKSLGEYQALINQRNIFYSSKSDHHAKLLGDKEMKVQINKIVTVVGILLDNDSKVIIEDKESYATFFLSQGSGHKGIFIERIEASKVIVRYKGRTVELMP